MSVITTRSTILSILRQSSSAPRNSLHRVRFKLPNDIKKIFMDFKSGANVKEYEDLVCTIRDSEIGDDDLLSLLMEAKNCISILNYDLRLFVQALILVRWTHRDERIVKQYQDFINDLVSAHSRHTKIVIDQLVKLFLITDDTEWTEAEPSQYQKGQFENIHYIIQSILELIPMSEDILLDKVRHNFPYVRLSTYKQAAYVYNALKIVAYQPNLQTEILKILIDKLVAIDVLAPREDILQFEEGSDNLLFEMEVDDDENLKSKTKMKHPLADALDITMSLVLKFIRNQCYEENKFLRSKCLQLFNELLYIFENVILYTHASHHVQFYIFYICSFERMLVQEFLKFLWQRVISPSFSPELRQSCVAYLSSFLARAKYVPLGYLKTYLSKMAEWVHSYILNHDGAQNHQTDIKHHCVFYSICQAIFYLIAFRHRDLIDCKIKLVFLQSLNLSKIVTCKLNPLRVCLPAVIENFASVTRACQLAYCYTVIEHNSRNTLPLLGRSGESVINPVMDMYFPFDPYVLKRSSCYIENHYREYLPVLSEEIAGKNVLTKRLNSEADDEDDFIGEENVGTSPIAFIKRVENGDLSYSME